MNPLAQSVIHYIPALLLASSFVVLVMMSLGRRGVRKHLLSVHGRVAQWRPADATEKNTDVFAALREALVLPNPVDAPGWPTPRFLLDRPVADVLEDYAEHATSGVVFVLGSLATGVALVFTFMLIALVLSNEVSHAILDSSSNNADAAAKGAAHLSTAVEHLGEKFWISAAGILAALLTTVANTHGRKSLRGFARAVAGRTSDVFCTPETYAAAVQAGQLGELRGMREDLTKLRSIEVSVKDLGTEVTASIRQMITQDLGQQIHESIQTVMIGVDKMSTRLETNLVEAFERMMQKEMPKVVESLEAIRQSVDGQASSPVERMLEKLEAVVSGGIKGESAQMNAALRQFAEVVPTLAKELQSVTVSLGADLRARSEENQKSSEAMASQVMGLLMRLEGQQASTEQAITAITRASSEGAEAMAKRFESQTTDLVESVLRGSRDEVAGILNGLRQGATANAASYATVDEHAAAAAVAIREASAGLDGSASAVKTLAAESRAIFAEARASSEAARIAAERFATAGGTVQATLEGLRRAVEASTSLASEQAMLVAEHRKQVQELVSVWPTLFDRYLKALDDKTDKLANGWNGLFDSMAKLSANAGGGLTEAAEDLKASVDQLVRHAGTNGRSTT